MMPRVICFFLEMKLVKGKGEKELDLESVNKTSGSRILDCEFLGNHFFKTCCHSLGAPFLRSQPV